MEGHRFTGGGGYGCLARTTSNHSDCLAHIAVVQYYVRGAHR